MKIGMVTTQYAKIGGVEKVVRELSKRLSEEGHEVVLITRDRPQNTRSFERFYSDVIILKRSSSFKDYLLNSREQFKRIKVDLFHFHNWSTILPTIGLGLKSVLTLHGTSTEVSLNLGEYHKVPLMWFLEEICMSIPKVLVSITRFHLRYFLTLRPTKIIRNGVDTKEFDPKKYDEIHKYKKKYSVGEGPVILTVGKLVKQKGTEYLIKALKYLEPKVELLIPSEGERKNFLRKLAKEVEKEGHRVKFLGYVNEEELKELFALSDIFVLPSLNEGLPLSLIEAMSFAKPVVATRVGGIPELVEPAGCGFLVNKKNPKQIAEKINILLSDEKLRKKLGSKGRRYVKQNLDWKKIVKEYLKVYREAILRGGRG